MISVRARLIYAFNVNTLPITLLLLLLLIVTLSSLLLSLRNVLVLRIGWVLVELSYAVCYGGGDGDGWGNVEILAVSLAWLSNVTVFSLTLILLLWLIFVIYSARPLKLFPVSELFIFFYFWGASSFSAIMSLTSSLLFTVVNGVFAPDVTACGVWCLSYCFALLVYSGTDRVLARFVSFYVEVRVVVTFYVDADDDDHCLRTSATCAYTRIRLATKGGSARTRSKQKVEVIFYGNRLSA